MNRILDWLADALAERMAQRLARRIVPLIEAELAERLPAIADAAVCHDAERHGRNRLHVHKLRRAQISEFFLLAGDDLQIWPRQKLTRPDEPPPRMARPAAQFSPAAQFRPAGARPDRPAHRAR